MDISFDFDRVKGVCHVMYISSPTQSEEKILFIISPRLQFRHFQPLFCRLFANLSETGSFFNRNFKHLDALYETIFECTSLRYLPVML